MKETDEITSAVLIRIKDEFRQLLQHHENISSLTKSELQFLRSLLDLDENNADAIQRKIYKILSASETLTDTELFFPVNGDDGSGDRVDTSTRETGSPTTNSKIEHGASEAVSETSDVDPSIKQSEQGRIGNSTFVESETKIQEEGEPALKNIERRLRVLGERSLSSFSSTSSYCSLKVPHPDPLRCVKSTRELKKEGRKSSENRVNKLHKEAINQGQVENAVLGKSKQVPFQTTRSSALFSSTASYASSEVNDEHQQEMKTRVRSPPEQLTSCSSISSDSLEISHSVTKATDKQNSECIQSPYDPAELSTERKEGNGSVSGNEDQVMKMSSTSDADGVPSAEGARRIRAQMTISLSSFGSDSGINAPKSSPTDVSRQLKRPPLSPTSEGAKEIRPEDTLTSLDEQQFDSHNLPRTISPLITSANYLNGDIDTALGEFLLTNSRVLSSTPERAHRV